ncbi:MAG: relaxase [Chitinophagaceae bacterium]|nr:MAG: relaxase [Chitinophagaceae bacterium]
MVARVIPTRSIRNVFHYNENKLSLTIDEKGTKAATLIHSSGFAKDTEALTQKDRIKTLEKLISLNSRTKYNTLHISLNFDPSEKNMPHEKLRQIVDAYMVKIGFAKQPYLVYEHNDADHPHLHIVTTNIQRNSKAINLHYIGRDRSEPARKQIEKDFNLVVAESARLKQGFKLKPVNATKVTIGQHKMTGLKRAITNVLDHVLPNYIYTSLPELNAVLSQYNVLADRGSEHSRIYKNQGLIYRAIDPEGKKEGVYIPASDFYNQPTLAVLQENFLRNAALKQPYKLRVKNEIDMAFKRQPGLALDELTAALRKEKIILVARINDAGQLYGVTYVDNEKRCVFNGSELGKNYSANEIRRRCAGNNYHVTNQQQQPDLQEQKTVQFHQQHADHLSRKKNPAKRREKARSSKKESSLERQEPALKLDNELSIPAASSPPHTHVSDVPIELRTESKKKKRKKIKR